VQTTVTARHCDIPDDLRARAREVSDRLAKIAHRPLRMEIVFDADHGQQVVELKMWLPRGHTYVARAEATEFRSALDRAAERLRSQLAKDVTHPARRDTAP
jgi:ribosome-associated translation inhibitor RaiA